MQNRHQLLHMIDDRDPKMNRRRDKEREEERGVQMERKFSKWNSPINE